MARLKRDHPEVAERLAAGEFRSVAASSLTQARDVLANAPDLAAQVEACALSLASAYEAILAARSLPMFEEAGRQRMAEGGKNKGRHGQCTPSKSRDDAAKVFKVGVNSVQQAKAVLTHAPELAAQV